MRKRSSDEYLYKVVRGALVRLLRDSLEFNSIQKVSEEQKQDVENEIIDDFLIVMDYLKLVSLSEHKSEHAEN